MTKKKQSLSDRLAEALDGMNDACGYVSEMVDEVIELEEQYEAQAQDIETLEERLAEKGDD